MRQIELTPAQVRALARYLNILHVEETDRVVIAAPDTVKPFAAIDICVMQRFARVRSEATLRDHGDPEDWARRHYGS